MTKNGVKLKSIIRALAVVFTIGCIFSFSRVQAATTIGANITTDGYLKLNTSAVPPSVDGTIHYDGTKFRCYENGAWKDCIGGISGTVLVNQGGTNITSYTAGDLLYATGATTLSKLPIGSTSDILTVSPAGVPIWSASTPLVITNTYVYANLTGGGAGTNCVDEAAAQVGDVCIVSGTSKSYICANATCTAGTDWKELLASSSVYLQRASNLSDLTNAATARTNLGLGAASSPSFAGLTLSGLTTGAVPFVGAGGIISEDTANLYWNNTDKRLGIGTNLPSYALDVAGDIRVGNGSSLFLGSKTNPDPTGTNGAMYYNTSVNKLRCFENSSWKDCDTGGLTTMQKAYENGNTVTTALGADIAYTLTNGNFTASGVGSVNLTPTGASSFTSAGVLTLTGGATSTWGTSAGNLNLAVNGAATGNVQIGTGGAGTATPDYLALDVKSTTGDPAGGAEGYMYYNTFDNKFRCYENTGWTDCISVGGGGGGGALSAITAAVGANSINNGDNAQVWDWSLSTPNKIGFKFGENVASTGADSAIVQIANTALSTATPLRVINMGTAPSFIVADVVGDTLPQIYVEPSDLTSHGHVAIGSNSFNPTNPEKLKVDSGSEDSYNIISAGGNVDNYLQINIKNRNSGISASSDLVATADNGDENVNYIDMGINSSGYNNPAYSIGGANDAYLIAQGDTPGTGNLSIGTGATGTAIKFHTGGSTAADEKMRIEDTGFVGIATTSPGSELDVKGTLRLSGSTSGYVGLAPAAAAGSTTYTLPAADGGAGQALVTNGSGVLSWASASSNWQKVATTLSPLTAGDDVTTSGDIYTSGTGLITSAGLLSGTAGLEITGGDVKINENSNFNTYINTGTSTGTVNIGSPLAGAVVIESSSSVTLQGGANTFTSPLGEIEFQPAGAATTGLVKIGDGGLGSTTPDLLALDVKSDAGDPGSGTNGAMYYNAIDKKIRCYIDGAWGDCASVTLSSISAASTAHSINNSDKAQTWNWALNGSDTAFTFGESTAASGAGNKILNVATLASSTADALVVDNTGIGESFRVNDSSGDTSPFLIDKDGNVAVGATSFDPFDPEKFKVESTTGITNVIAGYGDNNAPIYSTIRNRNSGPLAASIMTATADDGGVLLNYAAMGIVSSGFNDPTYSIAGPHDAFLFNVGDFTGTQGGNMIVGTAEPGMSVKFISGGGAGTANEQMRIDPVGNVGIHTTTPGSDLDVKGTLRLSGSTSGFVGLTPAAVAGSTTYTLPAADGSAGQALTTNGSGALSWSTSAVGADSLNFTEFSDTLALDASTSINLSTFDLTTNGTGNYLVNNTGIAGLTPSGALTLTGGATSTWSTTSGALNITGAGALALQGGAASSLTTTAGDITLQAAGAGTANVQIGTGGAGSTTPDLLVLDIKSDAGDPAGINGSLYYNADSNKFRCYRNGSWGDCSSAVLSSIVAAQASNSINNGDNAQTWNWNLTTAGKTGFTFGENTASTATGSPSILIASTLASSTAMPLFVQNLGANDSFRVDDSSGDTTPFLVDKDGNVAIGATSFDPTNPEKLKVDASNSGSINVISGVGQSNGTLNLSMQNKDAGTDAMSIIATVADNGSTSANTLAMGITSSGFNNPAYSLAGPNDGFLVNLGNNLILGTVYPGTDIKFITGGGFSSVGERMRIDSNGNVGIGTTSLNARLDISPVTADALRIEPYGAVAGNAGALEFMELAANGANYVGFKAPDNIAANITWTLPNVDGSSGNALATDGAGNLTWANVTTPLQRVVTTISPINAGDNFTTSGNLSATGTGTVTSAGLLTGNAGLTINGGAASINDNSGANNTSINTGTSTGTVTIGSANAGAIGVTSGAALTLTGGVASSFSTTTGDIKLQPAGSGTTGYVKIGEGQTGSTTPDMLALDVTSTAFGIGNPAGSFDDGSMYYNEAANKFRCHINGSWSDCDTTGGTVTLQSAYNSGNTIGTAGSNIAFTLNTTDQFTASGAGSVNLTPTGASSFTTGSGNALTLTGGGASTWSTSAGALTITSAAAATWGTSAGNLTLQAAGTGAGKVKIGTGGAGSTTPDMLSLDVKSDTGDPSGANGDMYYNEFSHVFRCHEAGSWKDCDTGVAAGSLSLQQVYNVGGTVTTSGTNPIAFTLSSGDFTASGTGAVNLTPTSASSFTSGGALTLTGGAASTWSTGSGALTVDSAAGLNLGTANATGITIGKSGITTTNIGTLQTGNAATAGSFKIADGSTNFVTLNSPAISSDYTLTLPVDDGTSGQALMTDGSGNLSWTSITGNLMTTEGDMLYRDGTGNARLPRGTNGQILQSSATTVGWVTPTGATVGLGNVTNDAQITKAIGTTKGDIIAYTASNTPVRLPIGGTNGFVLQVDSTQATGMKWAANTPGADSLDFTEFNDAMTIDANTSIAMASKNLTINDAAGSGVLTMTPGGALTLTAGAASTWSTGAGALTVDSAAGLNLGTANATGITIGKSGITTTNIGTLQTGNAATAGSFKIADGSTNFVTLNSPAISSDYTLTLPVDDGTSGQALTTNGTGTLAWSTVFTDPMTTRGDIIIRDATNATARLAKGTAGQVLKSDGTDIAYATLTSTDVGLGNVTNDAQLKQSLITTKGDLITYSTVPTRLPIGGTNGFVLQVDSTQATGMKWAANTPGADSLDFTEFNDAMTIDANTSIAMASKNLTINDAAGSGVLTMTPGGALTLTAGAASTWSTGAGALTVDSAAGLNLGTANATGITIGKSGITTTNIGTLQTGNAATAGSFKIADGSTNFVTLNSPAISSDYTLTLPVDDGTSGQALTTNGTGTLAWSTVFTDPMTTRGDIIIRDATNATARLAKGTAGQVLKSDGTDIAYATLTNTDVGLGNVTNDAQIAKAIGTTKGDLIAYTASNTPVRLPLGTNGQVLSVNTGQTTGIQWVDNIPSLNSLDFAQFKDTMALDASTSINLSTFTLSATGTGSVNLTPSAASSFTSGGALTLTAGAASTWSTTAGALTINSGTSTPAALNIGTAGTNALSLGNGGSTFALTSSGGLNVTAGGALTGVASIDTISTSATALTFAGAGTISSTTSSALILDSGTTGDVNLGTGANAKNIKIGNASGATNVNVLAGTGNVTIGTSDTAGTLLVLDTKTGSGDPSSVAGGMYYNSNDNKFRCYENGLWKDCITSTASATLQSAYTAGATITTAGSTNIVYTLSAGNFNVTGTGAVNLTPTAASQFTSAGALTLAGAPLNLNTTGTGNSLIGNGTGTVALTLGSDAQGDIYYRNGSGVLARLGPGTSGQFLQTQGAAANPQWASAFVPNIAQVYDAAGGTSITTSSIVIPFNTETVKDSNYSHSNGTNPSRITFNTSGYYKISYNISSHDTTDSRENVQCRGRIDGTTDIAPSKSYSYGRNTTDKDQTNTATFFYNATATHYLEIVCTLTGSNYTATTNAGESWVTLEFIR